MDHIMLLNNKLDKIVQLSASKETAYTVNQIRQLIDDLFAADPGGNTVCELPEHHPDGD